MSPSPLTAKSFSREMEEATKNYDLHVVCLGKLPEDLDLEPLVDKAIETYVKRGPGLRHAVALNSFLTVILSQTDGVVPLCSIYFNLSSPYLNDARIRSTGSLPSTS